MNNTNFIEMIIVDRFGKQKLPNNRERRRLARIGKKKPHHWVRTPKLAWKAFGRDDKHKWRRWHGWPWTDDTWDRRRADQGGWEYGSDQDVARLHIRAEFMPALTQEVDDGGRRRTV